MYKKGQNIFSTMVLFVFIVVGIIVISFLSVVTTPILQNLVIQNNITGGMAIIVNHFNLVLVSILVIVGLLIVVAGGGE